MSNLNENDIKRCCKKCGSNSVMMMLKNATSPIYKCLECGKESPISISEKQSEDKVLQGIRKHITKVTKSTDIPILISKIKKIRVDSKIGQGEISKSLKVSAQRYGTIERCENIPTATIQMRLCIIFNVTFNDLYDIVYVTKEQYHKLHLLIANVEKNGVDFTLEEDKQILELEKSIKSYEDETGISERKVYNNTSKKDSDKVATIKEHLKRLDTEYADYLKKAGAILKQKTVVEYYHWIMAKELIGYSE